MLFFIVILILKRKELVFVEIKIIVVLVVGRGGI